MIDRRSPFRLQALTAMGIAGLAACSSGGGGGSGLPTGSEQTKPDGSSYFADPHREGTATRLTVEEVFWGRLVDVHDLDEHGVPRLEPVFRDFVINENVQTNATTYTLESNAITQKTRLVIRRTRGAPDTGDGTFAEHLDEARANMPTILPKNDDGTSPEPFSSLPRNACLVVRFQDLLKDDPTAERDLTDNVRLLTGYPPVIPAAPRIVFDRNFGGVAQGAFHTTRVLIDLTVSEAEAVDMLVPQPLNSLGLDPSQPETGQPNVSLHLPTRLDFGSGQFTLLTNLAGSPLASSGNGPVDSGSATLDVVRAMRAGNRADANNGFLIDFEPPNLVGSWPLTVLVARADPGGRPGFDFVLDLQYGTSCSSTPQAGNIISIGQLFLEVTRQAGAPTLAGVVADVRVTLVNVSPVVPTALLGGGSLRTLFGGGAAVNNGCWAMFAPTPGTFPNLEVSPFAQATLRFSEPMDPASLSPFDSIQIVRGPSQALPGTRSLVVGTLQTTPDLREVTFTPVLPFAHQGVGAPYHINVVSGSRGVTDLAGNPLQTVIPTIDFTIDPNAELFDNTGVVLRFEDFDELDAPGSLDLRGQFTFDFDRGVIRPRPFVSASQAVDRGNPVPSIMIPFPPGVQTPLTPLGSKLQAVWRYADCGWSIRDETKYNLDVTGLNWSPIGGQVLSDFYEEFEIRLAHSPKLPDEQKQIVQGSKYPFSGLEENPRPFTDNILSDPLSPQKVVHPRFLGYRVEPSDLFLSPLSVPLMPWPLNRNTSVPTTFTWRDTAVLAKAGTRGAGVPMDIEVGGPLNLENETGTFAPPASIPSVGLPLLMEFRCYPSSTGIGLNPLDISLAINTSARPNFRAYSTGGLDVTGTLVRKNPDLELVPTGGFNPNSSPPGKPTSLTADNALYIGQLDYVIRVSRVHTVWIDSLTTAPRYVGPILEPGAEALPPGTSIVVEFRGADGFIDVADLPFLAGGLDPYGDVLVGQADFHAGIATWTADITRIDGARFFQMRFSFLNNIVTGLSPELSSIGVAASE